MPCTSLVRFLAFLRLSSALPVPVHILVPTLISTIAPVSVTAPFPIPIVCSSRGLYPRPCPRLRPRPVRVPVPILVPVPVPVPILCSSAGLHPRPRPRPRSHPVFVYGFPPPFPSPFPPVSTPVPVPILRSFVHLHPRSRSRSVLVPMTVRVSVPIPDPRSPLTACTDTGPCERRCWVLASTNPCGQRSRKRHPLSAEIVTCVCVCVCIY